MNAGGPSRSGFRNQSKKKLLPLEGAPRPRIARARESHLVFKFFPAPGLVFHGLGDGPHREVGIDGNEFLLGECQRVRAELPKSRARLRRGAEGILHDEASARHGLHERDAGRLDKYAEIRDQTGHPSDVMLLRYVRDGKLFVGNAAGAVLGDQTGGESAD